MLHREHLNHFGSKRNLYILNCLEYELSKFFVKEIKVDGLFKCTTQFIYMKTVCLPPYIVGNWQYENN